MGKLLRLFNAPEEALTLAYKRGGRDYRLGIHICPYTNNSDLMLSWQRGYTDEKEKYNGQVDSTQANA